MPHFSPLEIFFSHLLLLCSTLYHPLLSLVRLKVALHALLIVISRLTSSRLVCPDRLFFLSFCFFAWSFFFSFLSFCTLFISSLYLFSLPRNFFTLVFIVYYLAILVKHINKQTNKQTLKLGLRSFVFLFCFFFSEKMFLNNGYQTAAEKCCVPEHRENLNDWYARKHVDLHGCKLRELTVHAYFGCFYECLPLVYERCFCVGQVIDALVRAWKINSTTTTVHISWAYFWWMFSLHTLAEEAKTPLLFFSHECFTECRGYCRSSPIVREAVRSSPLVVRSLSESGEGTRPGFVFLLVRHQCITSLTDRTLRLRIRNCSWPRGRNLMPRPSYPGHNYG